MTEMDADWWKHGGPQASELMEKIEPHFRGYSRLVIAIALSRSIAAMLAPTNDESREAFLRRFPTYMRSMWRMMDAEIPRSEQ